MEKIIKDLVEMANEGEQEVLIAYNKNNSLGIYDKYQVDYIDESYQRGLINLEVYSTYEDIKEEIEDMLG